MCALADCSQVVSLLHDRGDIKSYQVMDIDRNKYPQAMVFLWDALRAITANAAEPLGYDGLRGRTTYEMKANPSLGRLDFEEFNLRKPRW